MDEIVNLMERHRGNIEKYETKIEDIIREPDVI